MAGVCNLARIWERKKLCHSFGNAVDLLLAVCMLVQEVADMLFHLDRQVAESTNILEAGKVSEQYLNSEKEGGGAKIPNVLVSSPKGVE